jgi:hypothetical protein
LNNCTASSSTLSSSSRLRSPASSTSNGANAYGGGISIGLGSYAWTELVVAAYSSLGLCICVSADGGMPPNSACSHFVKQVDWGANRHPQNKDARHNKQSSGCSAKDLAASSRRQLVGVFKLPVKHVPYFIFSYILQTKLVPSPPLRKPAGTLQRRGKPKFKFK